MSYSYFLGVFIEKCYSSFLRLLLYTGTKIIIPEAMMVKITILSIFSE